MTFAVWEKGKTMRLFDMDSKEDYLLDGKYKVATPYAPLVNVVEVVRCKDCTYYCPLDDSRPYDCLRSGFLCVRKEDFCSCGKERR